MHLSVHTTCDFYDYLLFGNTHCLPQAIEVVILLFQMKCGGLYLIFFLHVILNIPFSILRPQFSLRTYFFLNIYFFCHHQAYSESTREEMPSRYTHNFPFLLPFLHSLFPPLSTSHSSFNYSFFSFFKKHFLYWFSS